MNQYEAMFLFDPTFGNSFEKCEAEIRRLMERASAEIILCRKWDERRLTYRIKGRKRGVYVLVYFQAPADKVASLERDAKLSENILRLLVIRADGLGREPAYYATIEHNCTTTLLGHLNKVQERPVRFSLKLLLNGYIPELAYERGNLPTDAPFEEVMQRYAISAKAREAGVGPEFSESIREGIEPFPPGPDGL